MENRTTDESHFAGRLELPGVRHGDVRRLLHGGNQWLARSSSLPDLGRLVWSTEYLLRGRIWQFDIWPQFYIRSQLGWFLGRRQIVLSIESFIRVPMVLAQAQGGGFNLAILAGHLLAVVIYSVLGIVVLTGSFLVIRRYLPFSVTKEIEEDQNTALAIIMGAVIIGMSIIIAASIVG